jgi:hypothetical protein
MDQRTVRDIKRIYHSAKKEMVFRPMFERKLASYIKRRAPKNSVNWYKLRYEFQTIYRKCRDEQYSLKKYLKHMATFTDIAIRGQHKKVEIDSASLSCRQLPQ